MRTLLIDGDLFAYRVAAASEKATDFGDGQFILTADAEAGKFNLDETLKDFQKRLHADRMIVCISDKENYRKTVLPTYKSNRANVRRPLILHALLDHLKENYEVYIRPTLEADDVMGILLTNPLALAGEKVAVTMDKDLRSVAGLHWNPMKEGETKTQEPTLVTPEQAEKYFLSQVLSGDAVDGYSGCIGVGAKGAQALVEEPVKWVQEEYEVKRGPNKGQIKTRWAKVPTADIWECIVSHYERQGQTEEDALTNARVARILQHSDFDYKRKEPILWQPNR